MANKEKPLAHAVIDNFTVGHMAAALWPKKNHDMSLSVDNLYSLVEFWPTVIPLPPGTEIPPSPNKHCPHANSTRHTWSNISSTKSPLRLESSNPLGMPTLPTKNTKQMQK
ncbi:hypothetical protein [Massilia sp. CCM 8734]|uniref:hypothetical protein n=1 Tax=Massilia sp. CCM 8734 TaxID=2609283 RepID=UPI00141FA247|nr:hypothetical protein [Massilia sp. CCM 8734]NIA00653.1 hypothetical protein [Massilia sp. CCM 8734]